MSDQSVAVIGVGESRLGRGLDEGVDRLTLDAVRAAVEDAGIDPSAIDGVIAASGTPIPDDISAAIGFERRFTAAPGMPPGAGVLASIALARTAIRAGLAETVLVYYGYIGSKPGGPYGFHGRDPIKASLEMPFGWYGQPTYFAAWTRRYLHEHGLDESDLGAVACSNRKWAELTPLAQKRTPMSREDYLGTRMVSSPLRVADCSLISDGAGAVIITSAERARDLRQKPIIVAGAAQGALNTPMSSFFTQSPDFHTLGSRLSGPRAYADAGLGPADIDIAQIYDCFSIAQVIQLEDLGLVPRGEGFAFHAAGHAAPGGSLPVNTHGGHLSYAYIPGIVHIIEAVRQLRGTRAAAQVADAETAIVAALSGPDHSTLIFTKD